MSEERLIANGSPVFVRESATVSLPQKVGKAVLTFGVDWHLLALPIIQEQFNEPLSIFKRWLARMLILRPQPVIMSGDSAAETLEPRADVADFGDWFTGLLSDTPGEYSRIEGYLRSVWPDFKDIKNPIVAKDSHSLAIQFSAGQESISFPLGELSDGEKCHMICALVLATTHAHGRLFCFWDEPDTYLALSEVGHFIARLRQAFDSSDNGQFLATSHNPEAIRAFADDNTFMLHRKSHLEPTVVRAISELNVNGDLIEALIAGDVHT